MDRSPEIESLLESKDPSIYEVVTSAPGPRGRLPLSEEMLLRAPCGDVFGWIEDVGMGWDPSRLNCRPFLMLSTQGGIRASDGSPLALGYHTGHWELALLTQAAAGELRRLGCIPYACFCTDPCDGRTQGTPGMMDSLAYRNNAAAVFRHLVRSLPGCRGVLGVAGCDKGLPAMMMALASMRDLPSVIVPGGVTLPAADGEDLGAVQSLGARFAHGEITIEYAQEVACRACASPGGSCQFLGTAATSQIVAEALGLTLPHAALAPSGQAIWLDAARRSARALVTLEEHRSAMKDILTDDAVRNALAIHAAFGGSTNLLIHLPAIAHSAGLRRPSVEDWIEVNRRVPRLIDVLPNGPVGHPTVRVFLAGGVPEVMSHLRDQGVLAEDVLTVTGEPLGRLLDWWATSDRRKRLRSALLDRDGVDPDTVIFPPARARQLGLAGTVVFPRGNLAPGGSVIKSTAIDPSVIDPDGVYRKTGPARVFTLECESIRAIKGGKVGPGDILVLVCAGPLGSGMEEIYQITSALKHLSWGRDVAVVTDARFSGVSTGACIGHVAPEALASGPIGKVLEGDIIQIFIDLNSLHGSVDLVGESSCPPGVRSVERGERLLAERPLRPDLAARVDLPDDTRLWAALQDIGGGTWGGCVFDVDSILRVVAAGRKTLGL